MFCYSFCAVSADKCVSLITTTCGKGPIAFHLYFWMDLKTKYLWEISICNILLIMVTMSISRYIYQSDNPAVVAEAIAI